MAHAVTKRTTILKFRLEDDLRRRSVEVPFLFSQLVDLLRKSYPKDLTENRTFRVEYVDDEGDSITVTNDQELAELFNVFKRLGKRASLTIKVDPVPVAVAVASPVSAVEEPERKTAAPAATTAPPAPPAKHWGVSCDETGECPIIGTRYHLRGHNYDLCQAAYDKLSKEKQAYFVAYPTPPHRRRGWWNWRKQQHCPHKTKKNTAAKKYWMKFVGDKSVPDATVLQPGLKFVKSWMLDGAWPAGCHLVHVGGESLGAVPRQSVDENEKGGQQVVSVETMTAPEKPGRYMSYWRLCDPKGKRFGHKLWADVVVAEAKAETEGDGKEEPEEQPKKEKKKAWSKFVADETVPDGAVLKPGAAFVKTWLLKGSWAMGCELVHVGGDSLGADSRVKVDENEDGERAVSCAMTAPEKPGRYTSYWRLRAADGECFGDKVWALVVVKPVADATVVAEAEADADAKEEADVEADFPAPPTADDKKANKLLYILEAENDDEPAEPAAAPAAAPTVEQEPAPAPSSWKDLGVRLAFGQLGARYLNSSNAEPSAPPAPAPSAAPAPVVAAASAPPTLPVLDAAEEEAAAVVVEAEEEVAVEQQPPAAAAPEREFAHQAALDMLKAMGFADEAACRTYLDAYNGNVEQTVIALLG